MSFLTARSVPSPGAPAGVRWEAPDGADIQRWHLVRCDYPFNGPPQVQALVTGGLDLMVTRWELHPSARAALDDTGDGDGKHYLVLGEDARGDLHAPTAFETDADHGGVRLSKERALPGWIPPGKARRDRYSKVF